MIRRLVMCLVAVLLGSNHSALAQSQRIYFSSGTGFFVSSSGHVITNAHVVQHCKPGSITLSGAVNAPAQLQATDAKHDIALLYSQQPPNDIAELAATTATIQKGDPVMVMGFPLESAQNGQYFIAMAEVIDMRGPTGEPEWLQFSDAAQKGNSGGPLLDNSGNVIGVVTGKTELFRINTRTRQQISLGSSDIAVSLPVLKTFLMQNHVRYRSSESRIVRSDRYVENDARSYITQIKCITGVEPLR